MIDTSVKKKLLSLVPALFYRRLFVKINTKAAPNYTHGGAKAHPISFLQELRRSVMCCLLWEKNFYESGESIASRICELIPGVEPLEVFNLAIEARTIMKLRHVPLLLAREMARHPRHKKFVASLLPQIILRAEELAEFLAIYCETQSSRGKKTLSAQVKKGLAKAFQRFDEYQLAKYDRDGKVKLRDVLFLCHSKPADSIRGAKFTKSNRKAPNECLVLSEGEQLYKKIAQRELKTPDTWEVALSAGADKKASFERLMADGKLFDLAFLRNLRNMIDAGINLKVLEGYGDRLSFKMVLPFRFIAAALMVPSFEHVLEKWMYKAVERQPKLTGKTILIVDVSGSMYGSSLSGKSRMLRTDAASGLAILVRELAEEPRIYFTAGSDYKRIHATAQAPARRGFALRDLIVGKGMLERLGEGGIFLAQCLDYVFEIEKEAERIIVITDEQDCDQKLSPDKANAFAKHNYILNISSNENEIAYSKFTHINGWSDAVLHYIIEKEAQEVWNDFPI